MEQRLRLPGDRPDGDYLLESYDLLACSLFHQGAFGEALDQAERGLALYDPDRQYALIATFGEDPGVQCHGWAALSLWFLGHPDRALERAHAGLRLARSHLYSLACAQVQAAWIHQCRLEDGPVRQWAEAAVALASEQGFPYFHAVGRALRGWALAVQGQPDAGIAELREGLAACRAIGAMIDYPYLLALLAEASGRAGRVDEGLDAVAEGLTTLADGRSFFYEAELHRLRGALCLQAGGRDAADEADASFARALDIARRQRARSLELRALISRSQLWRRLGRGSEAWSALATACDWFADGEQTPDLTTARALIDELHGAPSGSRSACQ
jgi:adenylate cyclase